MSIANPNLLETKMLFADYDQHKLGAKDKASTPIRSITDLF
jgi:hypothetical protein